MLSWPQGLLFCFYFINKFIEEPPGGAAEGKVSEEADRTESEVQRTEGGPSLWGQGVWTGSAPQWELVAHCFISFFCSLPYRLGCSGEEEEQNLKVFQYHRQIHHQTFQLVRSGCEFLFGMGFNVAKCRSNLKMIRDSTWSSHAHLARTQVPPSFM